MTDENDLLKRLGKPHCGWCDSGPAEVLWSGLDTSMTVCHKCDPVDTRPKRPCFSCTKLTKTMDVDMNPWCGCYRKDRNAADDHWMRNGLNAALGRKPI